MPREIVQKLLLPSSQSTFTMEFIDLENLEDGASVEADLCIVGSGPAGAAIAMEFAKSKVRVLILEGGGPEPTAANQALYEVENVGAVRTTPQDLVRNRIVGGSSHTWSGRCAAFAEIDFEFETLDSLLRMAAQSADIHPFMERSRDYLGLGPNVYDDCLWKELGISPPRPPFDPAFLRSQFWQYSRDRRNPREPTRFLRTIADIDAPNVKLLMHANVTHINTSKDGSKVEIA